MNTPSSFLTSLRSWLPTRGNVIFTLLVVSLLFGAQAVGALPNRAPGAAVPSTAGIPYQGRLANAGGTPLTGTYTMVFRLYAADAGGAPLWEEQWTGSNGVKVSDGLFNVMLGSLNPLPNNVVTGNSSLWLGITVNTDNEMAPRVQLGSVPYAVQALTVSDGSIGTAKLADGAVTTAKIANGSLSSQNIRLSSGRVVGSGLELTEFSWQDVPGTQISLNLQAAQQYFFFVVVDMITPNSMVEARLYIDGVAQPQIIRGVDDSSSSAGTYAQTYLVNLNPGAHTVVLKATITAGLQGSIGPNTTITYFAFQQ